MCESCTLQALLEIVQPINSPIPLTLKVNRRSEIVSETSTQQSAYMWISRVPWQVFRGTWVGLKLIRALQCFGVSDRPVTQSLSIRRRCIIGRRNAMATQVDVIALLQLW